MTASSQTLHFLLTAIQVCSNFYFFAPVEGQNFSSRNLDFHKGSVWYCPSQCSPSPIAKSGWNLFTGHCRFHCQEVCLPISWRTGGQDPVGSLGVRCWIPQLPRGTFVHGWLFSFCCWSKGKTKGVLCCHDAGVTLPVCLQIVRFLFLHTPSHHCLVIVYFSLQDSLKLYLQGSVSHSVVSDSLWSLGL